MCQRWQDVRSGEFTLGEYQKLAEVFRRLGVHQISIAGGEPLLREDIFCIIRSFAGYGMSVNLCTNGILLEPNVDRVCGTGLSCVTVSLDGATPGAHESIRGTPGSCQQIESGIRSLVARPQSHRPLVRVRMTFSNSNMDEIRPYYRKWKDIADDVLLQPVHYCSDSFYTGPTRETFGINPYRLVQQLDGTPFRRDGYMRNLLENLKKNGGFPKHRCYAGILMARFDPWGNVFPCLEQHVCVGSVRKQDFETIWSSDFFDKVRRRIASADSCTCWYNNTALISHYADILFRTTARGVWGVFQNHGQKQHTDTVKETKIGMAI
jgi:MoaA/NifB/PqqE/SkfB family radical SAM enzyme